MKKKKPSHLRQSKSDDFLEKLKKHNPMVEYFTRLTVLNPAAQSPSEGGEKREGGYVRLAHAREEFKAPVLTKGKSVQKKPKRVP